MPLVRDVQSKLHESAANYDDGIVRIGQMCISIAAQCIADGAWKRATLTAQQRKFLPFSPDSYDLGEIAFSIAPRTLIPETPMNRIARAAALERLTTPLGLAIAGLDEEEQVLMIQQTRQAADFMADRSARAFASGI
jgi:hypothetical protein